MTSGRKQTQAEADAAQPPSEDSIDPSPHAGFEAASGDHIADDGSADGALGDGALEDSGAYRGVGQRGPALVPLSVMRAKFAEQIQRWQANRASYARRGWLLLEVADLEVEVGFLQQVPMGGMWVPVMTACVRVDYWNFDLWAPSVTFLDPLTREPAPPLVRAPDKVSDAEVRDVLIDGHPETGMPFLCLPGIREYHTHPQHNGDDWLLHRGLHEGDLAVLCDRIWRRMARNVIGLDVAVKSLTIGTRLDIGFLQGDADAIQRQLQQAQPPASNDVPGPAATRDSRADVDMIASSGEDSVNDLSRGAAVEGPSIEPTGEATDVATREGRHE